MLKILLVDDEELSIRMLKNLIDWQLYGIRVIGSANNGTDAYELFLKERPEIILTDIRMPGMDGLELTRRIKEVDSTTEIILISAYADFEYAREAIALGGANYLLKPVDEYELEKTLKKITEKIDTKNAAHRMVESAEAQKNTMAIYSYMRSGNGKGAALKASNKLGIDFDCSALMSFTLNESSMNSYIQNNLQIDAQLSYIHSKLSEHLSRWFHSILFDYYDSYWCALISHPTHAISDCAEDMAEFFADILHMEVHVCFTDLICGLDALPQAYKKLRQLNEYSYFIGVENVLGYGFNCDTLSLNEAAFYDARKSLCSAIEKNDLIHGKAIVEETLRAVPLRAPGIIPHIRDFCYAGLRALREKALRENNSERANFLCGLTYQDIEECTTLEELRTFMNRVFEGADTKSSEKETYSPLVQDGLSYLEQNFDRNISLEEICTALGVSRNYFSFLFKKETGENIWSYLTEIRLNKAKELLKNTEDKTYSIAYQVGYDNPSYFSKLFKKSTGMTPNEFRKGS